jgi:hypothetical protein
MATISEVRIQEKASQTVGIYFKANAYQYQYILNHQVTGNCQLSTMAYFAHFLELFDTADDVKIVS